MELTIKGVIRRINQPQEFASGKRKCEIHIELAEQKFEQIVPLEFWGDDVDEAIGLTVGSEIKAKCWLSGREWRKDETVPFRAFVSFKVFDYKLPEAKSIRETVAEKAKQNPAEANDFPF